MEESYGIRDRYVLFVSKYKIAQLPAWINNYVKLKFHDRQTRDLSARITAFKLRKMLYFAMLIVGQLDDVIKFRTVFENNLIHFPNDYWLLSYKVDVFFRFGKLQIHTRFHLLQAYHSKFSQLVLHGAGVSLF